MIDPVNIYLRNLAKRAIKGEHINPAEMVKLPQVLDNKFGNGDGVLDFDDIKDFAGDAKDVAVEVLGNIWDTIGSVLDF